MSEGKFKDQQERAKKRLKELPQGWFVVTRPLVTSIATDALPRTGSETRGGRDE